MCMHYEQDPHLYVIHRLCTNTCLGCLKILASGLQGLVVFKSWSSTKASKHSKPNVKLTDNIGIDQLTKNLLI
jgi:hypothetical protein